MLAALEEIRAGERPCSQLRIRYRDGSDELGWTTITVRAGRIRVERAAPEAEPQSWRGRLRGAWCQRLIRNAVESQLWRARGRRRAALEDETRPELKFGVHDIGRIRVAMFGFEAQDHKPFAVARGQLLILARVLSDGAVLY